MGVMKLLAEGYQRLDRRAEANDLLDRCGELAISAHESGWATPVLYVRLAEVYAQQGRTDEAIANVAIAVEKGFRDIGWLEYGIFWQDLQDHAGLNRLKVRILEDVRAQRADLQRDGERVARLQATGQSATR